MRTTLLYLLFLIVLLAVGVGFTLCKANQPPKRNVWNRSPNWKPAPRVEVKETPRMRYERLAWYARSQRISEQAAFNAYVESLKK